MTVAESEQSHFVKMCHFGRYWTWSFSTKLWLSGRVCLWVNKRLLETLYSVSFCWLQRNAHSCVWRCFSDIWVQSLPWFGLKSSGVLPTQWLQHFLCVFGSEKRPFFLKLIQDSTKTGPTQKSLKTQTHKCFGERQKSSNLLGTKDKHWVIWRLKL